VHYLILALAPGALILWWVYAKDRYEPEPGRLLWGTVGLGALSSVWAIGLEFGGAAWGILPSDAVREGLPFGYALVAASYVALAEESGKLLAVLALPFRHPAFNQWIDGIVYSVAAALGFATVENLLYVFGSLVSPFGATGALVVGGVRAVTAVPGHAVYGVLMGVWIGAARMVPARRRRNLALALILPAAAHAAYDSVLLTRSALALLIVPLLIGLVVFSVRAVRAAGGHDAQYSRQFWGWRARIDSAGVERRAPDAGKARQRVNKPVRKS